MSQPLTPLPISSPLPTGSKGFVSGFTAFLAGLKQVMPGGGLFRYAIAPMIVSFFVLIGVAIAAFFTAKYWLVQWFEESWIGWAGGVLAVLLALALAYLFFVPVMTLFGPLFIDPICEKVHLKYTGKTLIGERSTQAFIKRQLFAIVQSVKWTLVVLFIELPLTVVAIFTVVGAAIAIPVSAVISGADLMDYPLALRDYNLSRKLKWVKRRLAPVVGLGTASSLCMLVPLLNLLVIPAGAAGATILSIASRGDEAESSEHQG